MLGLNNYIIVTVVNAIANGKPTNYFDQSSTIMNAALNSIQASMGNQHARTDIQKQAYPPELVKTIRAAYGITGTNFNTHSPYINGKQMALEGTLITGTEVVLIKNELNPTEALLSASRHQLLPMKTNATFPKKLGEIQTPAERSISPQFEILGTNEEPGPIFGAGGAGQRGGYDDFGGEGI